MDSVIKKIADRFGEDILLESRKLSSLIDDYIPGDKKTANLLNAAIRNNIPKKLYDMKSLGEEDRETKIKELCAQFTREYALSEKLAYSIINQFTSAFKYPEVKFSAAKKPKIKTAPPAASADLSKNPDISQVQDTQVSQSATTIDLTTSVSPENTPETAKNLKQTGELTQNRLIELQMNAAKKARIPDILTLITGAFIIIALAAAMFIIPDETFSEQENRSLQQFPALSSKSEGKFLDRLVDGKFTADIAKYYSDQFPFRNMFVGLKGIVEIAMLKSENDDVILGKDDYLITKDSITKDFNEIRDILSGNIDGISDFADAMAEMKIPVTLAAAGRSIDVLGIYLPATYPRETSENLWGSFNGLASYYKNLKGLDLCKPLRESVEKQTGRQLYYRTDHHWTTLGAYYAYVEIIKSFKDDDLEPQPLSAFTREIASDAFYGTTWSKAGMKWIEPDTMEYFRYDGDEDFLTTIKDTGKSFNGFYDISYLDKKDKYSSFISGNNSRVDITKPGDTTRQKMLVIKDSFAHSVIPFLAYHFDLIILDYRYYLDSAAKLVFDEDIDRILFLHNISNISESNMYGSTVDEEDENIILPGILQYGVENILREYIRSQYPIRNIFINNNPITDYVIVIPTEETDTRKYYIDAAEKLQAVILEKMGLEIEIVRTDDLSGLDKIITFTPEGLPAVGFIRIATEGNNLIFRCNIGVDSPGYSAGIFISKYLGKNATGSFNFGENFVYSDIGDNVIMIRPGQ
ncbi:MAG: DHHW family protein [Oscillospiraceae bacterium]|nr:DHHW family protein [Oscillospiraceae bacterium]